MLVIIITVITQGPMVPNDLRGNLKGELFVNSGFFQAVGVISFGTTSFGCSTKLPLSPKQAF
jgi:hypothetical protein